MNYKEVISRICKNINVPTPSSNDIATIKEDVEDILVEAYTTAEAPKIIFTYDIPSDALSLTLPADMFVPFEVMFYQGGVRLSSKEMTIEEFQSWMQTTEVKELITIDSITTVITTEENKYYDGKVGYYFTHEGEKTILCWKPSIPSGKVTIVYSSLPTTEGFTEKDVIKIHRAFIDMLVMGASFREYRRRIGKSMNEVELVRNRTATSEYEKEYKLKLNNFAGFMNKETEPRTVLPFDYLNDSSMLL